MIHVPEMLLIGAASSDAGKTRLVCAVIERLGSNRPIVGIKVTTVESHHAYCPRRHGEGCGVCEALDKDFVITEELDADPRKDTGRMRAAGAERVFWLRARRGFLREGITATIEKVGPGQVMVCESTSLRSVVEPGVFLMVSRRNATSRKKSARAVWNHVDRFVEYDGEGFDLDLGDISLYGGRFRVKRRATAIILAGGESTRMKTDKSLLRLGDTPMIERVFRALEPNFQELLISANEPGKYGFLGAEVIPDRVPGQGPLMGIVSALPRASHDLVFVHACDIPQTDESIMARLLRGAAGADAAIPRNPNGHLEPLFAAYRKSALPALENALGRGARKVTEVLDGCSVEYLALARDHQIRNLNTQEEFRRYLEDSS